jgi:hypothetical protein
MELLFGLKGLRDLGALTLSNLAGCREYIITRSAQNSIIVQTGKDENV